MTEEEMMSDLAAADAAGDSALAQHIAGRIKTLRQPTDTHGMLAKGAHYAAKALPMAGGLAGGVLGGGAGLASGPGAILTGAAGAGLGAAGGRALQHFVDQNLGYEQPMSTADAVKDTVGTGLKDAAMTAGSGMALQAGAAALPMVAKLLNRGALATGRRVLTNVSGSLSKAKPLSGEAVGEAFDRGAFKFGGTSAGAAQRLETARETIGDQYNRIVRTLEAKGITGPDAQKLAQQYAVEGQAAATSTMNPTVPSIYESAAQQVGSKTSGRLGLGQTEELKRSLQGMAKSAYKQMQPNEVGKAHEATASMMRQSVEDEIAQQTAGAAPDVQAIAQQFVPIKQSLGKIIEASDASREGMARAGKRNFVSLPDWIAAAGGLRHGGTLEGILSGAATHLLRSRGPSTVAVSMRGAAKLAEALSRTPQAVPLAASIAGPATADSLNLDALIAALRRKTSPVPQLAANEQ